MVNKNKVKCDIEKVGGTCTVLWGKQSYDAIVLGIGMLDILSMCYTCTRMNNFWNES